MNHTETQYWREVAKTCLLLTVWTGSRTRRLHASQEQVDAGLAKKVSDYDKRSVLDWPDQYRYTLSKTPPDTLDMPGDDYEAYALMKFMGLLYSPSAEAQEMLWSPVDYNGTNGFGDLLRQVRHKFTSKELVGKLVAAAGFAPVDLVEEYVRGLSAAPLYSKGMGMLGKAVRERRDRNEHEARKALTDSVRRLLVAWHMLQPFEYTELVDTQDDSLALKLAASSSWQREMEAYNQGSTFGTRPLQWDSEDDGRLYVQLPETQLAMLRDFRFSTTDHSWRGMLHYRNEVFTRVQDALSTSKLREKADPAWGAMFLKMFAEGRMYWHDDMGNSGPRRAVFYLGVSDDSEAE